MTRRVNLLAERDSKSEYQLPPGNPWWLCRYADRGYVSEMLFTHESARTWFQARAIANTRLVRLGLDPIQSVVTLHE